MSRAQLAERKARLEALCLYIKKPSDYDIDAHADEVLQIVDQLHRTREWTAPDGPRVHLEIERGRICFRKPREKAVDQPKPEDGTATPEDAMEHLRPLLGKTFGELDFRYYGDDKAIEAELNAFRKENKDVELRSMVGYGGDAFDGDLDVFLRTCKLINKPGPGRKTGGVPDEALVVFCEKQRTPVLVPKYCYDINNPKNGKTKKAIVDSSLFLVVDSVAAENELRKRPCHAERILHMMEEKDEVVMAKPFRGRVLWPAEKYAFCTQASKALAPVSRGPLGAEDKVECWVAIHVAKHFRAPTPDEHAAFVASKDREKATRKLHDADKKRGAKAKKHKATTATGALE